MIIGAHLSISGGLEKALESAEGYGFNAVALFLRNQRQWSTGTLTDQKVDLFRETRKRTRIITVVAHGSYLVNLAGEAEIRRKSIDSVIEDLTRCGKLGIEYLVLHPGSSPDLPLGISRIADGLNQVISACKYTTPTILLETTAGQGNCIGHRFEQLADIIAGAKNPNRFGVCLDTAHIFAAGYDFRTKRTFQKMMRNFDQALGMDNLRVIHCNDSRAKLAARVDRHAHIGSGHIGLEGFGFLLRSRRLCDVPIILETPKGLTDTGEDWDSVNSKILRDLAAGRIGKL